MNPLSALWNGLRHGVKRIVPASLFGRALLILILPTVLVQLLTAYIFFERHWEDVSNHMSSSLAGEIAFIVNQVHQSPPAKRDEIFHMASMLTHMNARFASGAKELPQVVSAGKKFPAFEAQLRRRLPVPFVIEETDAGRSIAVSVKLSDGVLRLETSVKRLASRTIYIFVWWMVGSGVLFLLIATVFLRNQVRPIRRLAEAAESFGKGQERVDFRPSGALEVRRAGRAFLVMRERINRQVSTRLEMLAGISHDLRTPLTRMKLQLAMLRGGTEIQGLQTDVAQMEHMIQEYLDFARGEGGEPSRLTTLSALLEEVTGNYRRQGQHVSLSIERDAEMSVRVHAFGRLMHNIVDNAIRYGGRAHIQARAGARHVEIFVDDEGPGIPEGQRDLAFRAFTRLDPARSPETGGAGLGLTIARDIALGHGGEIELSAAPCYHDSQTAAGLRVIIRLPR